MARPIRIETTDSSLKWTRVPMPGANKDLEIVPLASSKDVFALLCKFPQGFERLTPGGYHAFEEFLVIDGSITLEEFTFQRGDLNHVPKNFLRTKMVTETGCLALAWFSGPAIFRAPEELLDEGAVNQIQSINVLDSLGERVFAPAEYQWSWVKGDANAGEHQDFVSQDLKYWHLGKSPDTDSSNESYFLTRTIKENQ